MATTTAHLGTAAVGVTGEILSTTFFARAWLRTREFMRYSAHGGDRAPRSNVLPEEALRTLILAQHQELISKDEQLLSREREIEHLQLLLAKLHRMQFGRKSEKLQRQIEQLELRLEELESNRSQKQATPPEPASPPASTTAAKPTRRALPEHLSRETHQHEPKETVCPQCQGELRKLSEDVAEVLEYVPASFRVIRHVRPKLSCTKCDCIVSFSSVRSSPRVIAKGLSHDASGTSLSSPNL